ncbi:MAG: hypothetical protein NTW20_10780 [Rhodobacterales bacterium]|nr:hypothetical protein [Rhodobacterales bacterium]
MILMPALVYFAMVFAVAFVVGALRVTMIAPQIGALAAVALEVPVILGLSWVVAGRLRRRWPLATTKALGMGAIAFVLLMLAEFGLAVAVFGQSTTAYAASFTHTAGALGLAAQIGFALIPALRAQTRG